MNIRYANRSKKDPFLNGFMVIDKTAVSAIFTGKNDLADFSFFAGKMASDGVFWPVVDRWLLRTFFNMYFKTRV